MCLGGVCLDQTCTCECLGWRRLSIVAGVTIVGVEGAHLSRYSKTQAGLLFMPFRIYRHGLLILISGERAHPCAGIGSGDKGTTMINDRLLSYRKRRGQRTNWDGGCTVVTTTLSSTSIKLRPWSTRQKRLIETASARRTTLVGTALYRKLCESFIWR